MPNVLCNMFEATFELYEDSAKEWRWRLRHRNTEIIADSGEGVQLTASGTKRYRERQANSPRSTGRNPRLILPTNHVR